MNQKNLSTELLTKGYQLKKIFYSEPNQSKCLATKIQSGEQFYLKIFLLKDIYRGAPIKSWIKNEIACGETTRRLGLFTANDYIDNIFTQTYLAIIYSYCKHITLEQYIIRKKLSQQALVIVLKDIVRLMYELRKAGLIHRHLTPDKIMITPTLIKFSGMKYIFPVGKSKFSSDEHYYFVNRQTDFLGLAPEVLTNKFVGYKTNIYNFGVLAFLLLFKRYPFEAKSIRHMQNLCVDGRLQLQLQSEKLNGNMVHLLRNSLQLGYGDRISLTEVRDEIMMLYAKVKPQEESLRQKLYFLSNDLEDRNAEFSLKRSFKEDRETKESVRTANSNLDYEVASSLSLPRLGARKLERRKMERGLSERSSGWKIGGLKGVLECEGNKLNKFQVLKPRRHIFVNLPGLKTYRSENP